MKRLAITPLLLLLVLLAGCGGSGGDPDADPAAAVPARAPVYVEASLDPDDDVTEVARKLTGAEDPGAELVKLLERATNEGGGDFDYEKDVKPWIGDRLGVFATAIRASGGSPDAEGALVAATKDPDKAQETLDREIERREAGKPAPRVSEKTYRDVKYKVDAENETAFVVVGDYAVLGTEPAVKAAIDATKGDALADADAYKQARDQVTDDGVGFAYLRLSTLISSLGPQGAALRPLLGQLGETVGVALDADKDALRVETATLGGQAPAGGGSGGPGDVLAGLPGSAWLAVGVSDVGKSLDRSLRQFGQLGAFGGVDVDQILGQVEQQTGIDLRQDLLSWMGDAGIFVRGASLSDIGGALVVASSDPGRTAQVIPKLGRALERFADARVTPLRQSGVDEGITVRFPQLPVPIHLAAAGDRFILAVTDAALEAALDPGEPLSDNASFKEAADQLGDGIKPSFFLDVAPPLELLETVNAFEGEDGQKAREIAGRFTVVAAGGKREDDVQRGRLVIGVK